MSPEIEDAEMALCAQAWEQYVQQEGGKEPGFDARRAFRAAWFLYAQHRMAHMPPDSALPVARMEHRPDLGGFTFEVNERAHGLSYGTYALYAARTTR